MRGAFDIQHAQRGKGATRMSQAICVSQHVERCSTSQSNAELRGRLWKRRKRRLRLIQAYVACCTSKWQVREMLGRKSTVIAQYFSEWQQGERVRKRAKREESSLDFAARPNNSGVTLARDVNRMRRSRTFMAVQVYACAAEAVRQGWHPDTLMNSALASASIRR